MVKVFSGDYRILKVVLASSDPISTMHSINIGTYSIKTLLDVLEMLDIKETIQEDINKQSERK